MDKKQKPKVRVAKILSNIRYLLPDDEAGKKALPNLMDCLCPQWQDGHLVKQPGRLTIRVDGPSFLVNLECPTEGVQTTVEVSSLATALQEFEKAISSNQATWKPTWKVLKKYSPTVADPIE